MFVRERTLLYIALPFQTQHYPKAAKTPDSMTALSYSELLLSLVLQHLGGTEFPDLASSQLLNQVYILVRGSDHISPFRRELKKLLLLIFKLHFIVSTSTLTKTLHFESSLKLTSIFNYQKI